MLKKLFSYELTDFKKNVAIIFSGSVFSQAALILATPWISRLYTPEQYGIYGLFLSIATIAGASSSFRYTTAIQITAKAEDAQRLMKFCRILVFIISIFIFIALIISYPYVIKLFSADELNSYIFLLPLSTLFIGLIETYSIWLNRNKNFKTLSYNRVLTSIIMISATICWAYIADSSFKGLLAGMILSQGTSAFFLHLQSRKFEQPQIKLHWKDIKVLLKLHKKFPIYSFPADLINVFTNQLPVFMLNKYAGSAEVGYFNMSNRILGLPSIFVSTSVGEVFRQRATEDYHKFGNCRLIYLKTFKLLFLMGIIPFLIIVLVGPWLFSFFLGTQWRLAGVYSQILSLMFFFRFLNSPLSYVIYIANKQQYDIIGVLIYSIVSLLVFFWGFKYFNVEFVLILYVICFIPIYLAMFALNYKFSKYENK